MILVRNLAPIVLAKIPHNIKNSLRISNQTQLRHQLFSRPVQPNGTSVLPAI